MVITHFRTCSWWYKSFKNCSMVVDLRPYGRLPALALWCFWGTCFYSFVAYQMYGERGLKNRRKIGLFLGLIPPEDNPEEREWAALLDETTYSDRQKTADER